MTRRLLPYEHQLIEALDVTEEEYLDFLAATQNYSKSPAQILEKPQAFGIDLAIAALVLTVVGTVFQVAAALLARPPAQQRQRQNQQAREQRFSPRFGFNSSQDLAQYGDPVNLVYCNTTQNPRGAVRVATSLVWSSIEAFGSSQFMQLLLVVGAANIKRLNFQRTAFGQLPLGQFSASNTWLYYNENGRVRFSNRRLGDARDPSAQNTNATDDVCKIASGSERAEGFSQTFSPSSLTSIGVYDPTPINVEVMERSQSGNPKWASNRIRLASDGWGGNDGRYKPGDKITVIYERTFVRQSDVAKEASKDLRYQAVASLDRSSTYMLGSAEFKLLSVNDDVDIDKRDITAVFECIGPGRVPATPYNETRPQKWSEEDRANLEEDEAILSAPFEENTKNGPQTLAEKNRLRDDLIKFLRDDDDFRFQSLQTRDFRVRFDGVKYDFTGTVTITWKNELDKGQSFAVPRGGSIAYTKKLLEDFLANKPKLSVVELRDELSDDLERIRTLRDDIMSGDYDKAFRQEARRSQALKNIRTEIGRIKSRLEEYGEDTVGLDKDVTTISNKRVLTDRTTTKGRSGSKRVRELEERLEDLREDRDSFLVSDVATRRTIYVRFLRNATGSFTGIDGNRYGSGGIKAIKRRLSRVKGEFVTDQIGVNRVKDYMRGLIREKEEALGYVQYVLKNWESLLAAADDNFFTKCLVKADYAAYQTVTACDYVRFSIRCRLFRRIQGRQKKYGERDAPDGYKLSDNGLHGRVAFFKVEYRRIGQVAYTAVPVVFAARRRVDQDNFVALMFRAGSTNKYEFRFLPIGDIGAEIADNGQRSFAFIENAGKQTSYSMGSDSFTWTGRLVSTQSSLKNALIERGPIFTNEWDLFSVRSDTSVQFSFESGPEFKITAVTEQQRGSLSGKYSDMSMMALGIFSGKGVQDLRSITAYVTEGKNCWIVNESNGNYALSNNSSSYAPDIFTDTILSNENGIGKYAKPDGIDWQTLALSKRFCKNNGLGTQLFMDGVIAEPSSWRQFWAETAPYSLLEFAKIGGKETLIPAIPCNQNGVANREVSISALFTTGNILEGSYKEEFLDYGDSTQDLIATVIYRDVEREDVFQRDASVQVSLRGVNENAAIRQTFDLSQFVSTRAQAILYGKLLCNQRRWMRRGIEFKTFPTSTPVSPGAYIYVDIGLVRWQRTASGKIIRGGVLNAPLSDSIADDSYSVLLYQNGQAVVSLNNVSVTNGQSAALAAYEGWMFVLGKPGNKKQVYRVTEVSMDEEGEVTVKAMDHPCEEVGGRTLSQVANFSDSLFSIV